MRRWLALAAIVFLGTIGWLALRDIRQLRPAASELAGELQAYGADVSFHVWPGCHNGRYWDAHFADYLRS
jgi:hypothetical protein